MKHVDEVREVMRMPAKPLQVWTIECDFALFSMTSKACQQISNPSAVSQFKLWTHVETSHIFLPSPTLQSLDNQLTFLIHAGVCHCSSNISSTMPSSPFVARTALSILSARLKTDPFLPPAVPHVHRYHSTV